MHGGVIDSAGALGAVVKIFPHSIRDTCAAIRKKVTSFGSFASDLSGIDKYIPPSGQRRCQRANLKTSKPRHSRSRNHLGRHPSRLYRRHLRFTQKSTRPGRPLIGAETSSVVPKVAGIPVRPPLYSAPNLPKPLFPLDDESQITRWKPRRLKHL